MADNKPMTVDELNALLGPQKSAAPSQPQAPVSTQELTQLTQKPQGPTVGLGEDLARSVGAGLGTGALGLAGLPGDVRNLVELGLQKTGMGSLGERYVPTSEEVIAKAKEVMPSLKQHLEYDPQYDVSRYAKTAAEFAPGALIPGGGLGLGARVAGSVGAGLATQAAEDYVSKTPLAGTGWDTAIKIGAGLPGFAAGQKALSMTQGLAGGALRPGAEAMRRGASAYGEDIARGGAYGAKILPEEVAAVGAAMPPAAAAGKETQALLTKSAQRATPEAAGSFETAVEPFRSEKNIKERLGQHIDNIFGGESVNALDQKALIEARSRQLNSQNYGRVMEAPEAQSITMNPTITGKLPEDVIPNVARNLQESGIDAAGLGLQKTRDGWQMNPAGMPLRFWDEVKQAMDLKINQLKDPVTGKINDWGAWQRWNKTNNELKSVLDTAVPDYAKIRGAAAEAAGSANAIEMGMDYLKSNNPKQIRTIEGTLNRLTPEQRYDFAYGVAGHYKDLLDRDPKAALSFFTGSKGGDRIDRLNRAMAPLGPDAGYQLVGRAQAELLNSQIKSLVSTGGKLSQYLPYAGGFAGLGIDLANMYMQPQLWNGDPKAFALTLAGMGAGKVFNMKEARVASKVLEMMADPAKHAQLGKLAAQDATARSFLGKSYNYMGRAVAPGVVSDAQRQEEEETPPAQVSRPGRASGGRIHGMQTAEMLMRAAHRAKLKINKDTEQILDQPDESVVKALDIASKHI